MAYKTQKNSEVFFVNYDLRKEEKDALKKIIDGDPSWLFTWLEKAVDDGYAFTVKKDTYNDCIGAFMRQTDEGGENQGLILTGRGKTAYAALCGCLYRHGVLFMGEWDNHRGKRGATDDE